MTICANLYVVLCIKKRTVKSSSLAVGEWQRLSWNRCVALLEKVTVIYHLSETKETKGSTKETKGSTKET